MTTVAEVPKIEFTDDQVRAKDAIIEFVKSGSTGLFTMGGYAGTGKTTVIAGAIKELRGMEKFKGLEIAFCCFTGKASTVLRAKLQEAGAVTDSEYCGTIHGLIYQPRIEDDRIVGWNKVSSLKVKLIVLDEASMVGDTIFQDLRSYGVPIIAVGDHGQLPPVFSKFNLMERPMIRLEKIHRQAEGNPIIHLSMLARKGEPIPFGEFGDKQIGQIHKIRKNPGDLIRNMRPETSKAAMILCGINRTRIAANELMRQILGFKGLMPRKGEKVICLKNNRREGIFNGMAGIVAECLDTPSPDYFEMQIQFDGMPRIWNGSAFKHQFGHEKPLRFWKDYKNKVEYTEMDIGNLFDFGYCITVHKAQGSQAENVVLIEERMRAMSDDTWNRWRYTGITRSSKNLIIVSE